MLYLPPPEAPSEPKAGDCINRRSGVVTEAHEAGQDSEDLGWVEMKLEAADNEK